MFVLSGILIKSIKLLVDTNLLFKRKHIFSPLFTKLPIAKKVIVVSVITLKFSLNNKLLSYILKLFSFK